MRSTVSSPILPTHEGPRSLLQPKQQHSSPVIPPYASVPGSDPAAVSNTSPSSNKSSVGVPSFSVLPPGLSPSTTSSGAAAGGGNISTISPSSRANNITSASSSLTAPPTTFDHSLRRQQQYQQPPDPAPSSLERSLSNDSLDDLLRPPSTSEFGLQPETGGVLWEPAREAAFGLPSSYDWAYARSTNMRASGGYQESPYRLTPQNGRGPTMGATDSDAFDFLSVGPIHHGVLPTPPAAPGHRRAISDHTSAFPRPDFRPSGGQQLDSGIVHPSWSLSSPAMSQHHASPSFGGIHHPQPQDQDNRWIHQQVDPFSSQASFSQAPPFDGASPPRLPFVPLPLDLKPLSPSPSSYHVPLHQPPPPFSRRSTGASSLSPINALQVISSPGSSTPSTSSSSLFQTENGGGGGVPPFDRSLSFESVPTHSAFTTTTTSNSTTSTAPAKRPRSKRQISASQISPIATKAVSLSPTIVKADIGHSSYHHPQGLPAMVATSFPSSSSHALASHAHVLRSDLAQTRQWLESHLARRPSTSVAAGGGGGGGGGGEQASMSPRSKDELDDGDDGQGGRSGPGKRRMTDEELRADQAGGELEPAQLDKRLRNIRNSRQFRSARKAYISDLEANLLRTLSAAEALLSAVGNSDTGTRAD